MVQKQGLNEAAFSLGHGLSICRTPYVKCSQKLGEQSLGISRVVDKKPVKKVGKNEHHLWKERDSAGSGQKALNLDRIRIQYAKTKSDCIAKMMETLFPEKRKRSKKKNVTTLRFSSLNCYIHNA
ncbi:uncharacterized protein [Gossypium hirsutum]|uniref:Uncharacterized protein n=1 Tax=Gossypium hirsutum TaxID=3635 RepID=A0ABM2YPV1_GOSHI|nr:uncharacterized protein LOC107952496 [Gossypium hirsutum]